MGAAGSKFRQIANSAPIHFQTRTDPSSFRFLPSLAICFLTINTVIAVVRSLGDPLLCHYVVFAYLLFMILLWLSTHRRPEGSEENDRLRFPIWAGATALNIVIPCGLGMNMNVAGKCFVWGMAAITGLIGFYMFFIYQTSNGNETRWN